MKAPYAALVVAGLVAALAPSALGAPTPKPKVTPPPHARIATYTSDQAWSGRMIFINQCGECHGGDLGGWFGPALARQDSNVPWQSPSDVWAYMTGHMPVGNAGGLPERDYVNIMAYLMQQSGRKPTKTTLTANAIQKDTTPLDLKP